MTDEGRPDSAEALEKAVMTVGETAAYLGCHPNSVYKYIKERGLPCVKLSRALFRIQRTALDDWLRREATGAGGAGESVLQ